MDSWLAPFVPRRSISTISAMPEWQSICEAGTMLRQLPQARPPPAAAGAVRAVADSISPAAAANFDSARPGQIYSAAF